MKKGLKRIIMNDTITASSSNDALMKKGLKPHLPGFAPYQVRSNDALMKKGLKRCDRELLTTGNGFERRPDEEGIET